VGNLGKVLGQSMGHTHESRGADVLLYSFRTSALNGGEWSTAGHGHFKTGEGPPSIY